MDSPATTSSTFNLECPISIKWTISEDKLMALKDSKDGFLETELFNTSNIPGAKYHLRIYPSKYNDDIYIYLHAFWDKEEKIKIFVNYTIESAHYTRNEKRESGLLIFTLCKTADLFNPQNKFNVDGKFTMKCEGFLSVERKMPAKEEIKFDTGLVCYKLWINNDKDFTFSIGESCVKAHKCILAAQSPFFKNMFKSDKKVSRDITDFSVKVVEKAVQFCYLGETSTVLDLKDKMGLLEFFDKYEINDLKTRFEASLIHDVSISNVCLLANCSIRSKAAKLEEACIKFLIKSLKNGTILSDIGQLDKDFSLKVIINACCNNSETGSFSTSLLFSFLCAFLVVIIIPFLCCYFFL